MAENNSNIIKPVQNLPAMAPTGRREQKKRQKKQKKQHNEAALTGFDEEQYFDNELVEKEQEENSDGIGIDYRA